MEGHTAMFILLAVLSVLTFSNAQGKIITMKRTFSNSFMPQNYLIPIFAITFTTQNLPILTNYKTSLPLGKTRTSDLEIKRLAFYN